MDEILTTYLDSAFLDWVVNFFPLVVAGLLLGVCVYFLGWLVATLIAWLKVAV